MSTATPAALRDPEALSRIGWALAAVVVLWPLLLLSGFNPALLLDPQNLKAMGILLGGILPPETTDEFLELH